MADIVPTVTAVPLGGQLPHLWGLGQVRDPVSRGPRVSRGFLDAPGGPHPAEPPDASS
jgi:hypothetical protein